MSHNDFTRPSGQWPNEIVPGAGDYLRWDATQAKLLNGTDGGGWSPSKPIILGGAGVQFTSPSSNFAGGLRTQTGGRLQLGTWDIPVLRPPRTRKIVMDLVSMPPVFSRDLFHLYQTGGGTQYQFGPDAYLFALPGPGAAGVLFVGVDGALSMFIPVPREYLHIGQNGVLTNGAQLSAINLNFRVINRPSATAFANAVANPLTLSLVTRNGKFDSTGTPQGFAQLFTAFLTGGTQFIPGGPGPGQWNPGQGITAGQYVLPLYPPPVGTPQNEPSSYFRASTNGVTVLTPQPEPNWNYTPGSLTTEGPPFAPFANWICVGQTGMFLPSSADAYFNQGNPQTLRMDLDLTLGTKQCLNEDRYYVLLDNLPNSTPLSLSPDGIGILYHSVVFEFANITSMYWP